MDFCIEDGEKELEKEKLLSSENLLATNTMTFVDFKKFEECYLSSYAYNDPGIKKLGLFSLQFGACLSYLFNNEDSDAKLR